jgi:hypothetical protein
MLITVSNPPKNCEKQTFNCENLIPYSQTSKLSTGFSTGVYTSFTLVIQDLNKGLTGFSTLSTAVNNVVNYLKI